MHTRTMYQFPVPPPRRDEGKGRVASVATLAALVLTAAVFIATAPASPESDGQLVHLDNAAGQVTTPTTFRGKVTRLATMRALPAYPDSGRIEPSLTLPEYGHDIPAGTELTFECSYDGEVVGRPVSPNYTPEQQPPGKPGSNTWYRVRQPETTPTEHTTYPVLPQAWVTITTPGTVPSPCPDDDSPYDPGRTQAELDQCRANLYICGVVALADGFARDNDDVIAHGDFRGDSRTDAARHCLLELYIAAFVDQPAAELWGDAHEQAPGTLRSHEMDQHNNLVARALATDQQLRTAMNRNPLGIGHLSNSGPRTRIKTLCQQKIQASKRIRYEAKPWPANDLIYFDPDIPIK
jgi:Domain of unknown function (DUF6973)